MPAYHHPPAHRLTVPLVLLLLTAGGLVLTTIRSYPPAPETINKTIQDVLVKPTQTSLNDLFDTIGSHPDRESNTDYNYCQARRPDTKSYPAPKVNDACQFIFRCAQGRIMMDVRNE